MRLSRRHLIFGLSSVVGVRLLSAGSAGASQVRSVPEAKKMASLASSMPRKADFQAFMNQPFPVQTESGQLIPLKLVGMTDNTREPRLEQFVLTFKGSPDQPLTETIYSFKHAALGKFDLAFLPASDPQEAIYLVTICNFV